MKASAAMAVARNRDPLPFAASTRTSAWCSSTISLFVHVHDVETAGMKTLVAGQVLAYNTTARDGRLTLTLQTFASVRASFASIGQQELNPCDRNSLPFLGGVSHN
jgi:hypothetical protein